MDANLKKMRDAVANAGARRARAALKLAVADQELEAAQSTFMRLRAQMTALFDVRLLSAGTNKIMVIKAIREITNLGLKEALEVANDRALIVKGVFQVEAERARKLIEAAGGSVRLEPVEKLVPQCTAGAS